MKLKSLAIVALAALGLAACEKSDNSDNSSENKQFIASVILSQNSSYWQQVKSSLQAAASDCAMEIKITMANDANDVQTRIAKLNELAGCKGQLKGIIHVPGNTQADEAALKAVQATGATLICIDSPIPDGSPLEKVCKTTVLTDNATEAASLYQRAVKDNHSIILVLAQDASGACTIRKNAVEEIIGDSCRILTVSQDDQQRSQQINGTIDSMQGLTALVSLNGTSLTDEVLAYCKQKGISIYTFDTSDIINKGLSDKTVKCAYVQDIDLMAKTAVEAICKDSQVKNPTYIPTLKK